MYYSFWYYIRMSLPAGIMGVLERSSGIQNDNAIALAVGYIYNLPGSFY